MLEPKTITLRTQAGVDKDYIISKFPAIAGREIVAKYPLSAMPKLGDYAVNEETMLKLMAYVGVPAGEAVVKLTTRALVDSHVPDWETLARIELAIMEYNCSFFAKGVISNFLGDITLKAKALITKILMDSSVQSFLKEKQPFKN